MVDHTFEAGTMSVYEEDYPYVQRSLTIAADLIFARTKKVFDLTRDYEEVVKSYLSEFMMQIKIHEGWILYDYESLDFMVEGLYLGDLDYLIPSYNEVRKFLAQQGYFFSEGSYYHNPPVQNVW